MTISLHETSSSRAQRLLRATLRNSLRLAVKPLFHSRTPLPVLRHGLALTAKTTLSARGVQRERITLGGVAAERYQPREGASDKVVLFLHGGAYCAGGPATHRSLITHLARRSGATVIALDYALAPEVRFPGAVNDAVSAYRALLDEGLHAEQISIAGDSAGGGLTLACALAARDQQLPQPAGLLLLSPWADIRNRQRSRARGEVMLNWEGLDHCAEQYASGQRDAHLASPLLADLGGLARTLIITGSDEILLGDSERLVGALNSAGVPADLRIYQDMWHVFPLHAGVLHDADHAIAEMAAFISGQDKAQ